MNWPVIIEWDGEKPPTTFYNRLRAMGMRVRGDKDKSPLERRAIGDGSVIVQEGAIFCASESLAREIATLATELGAAVVQIGRMENEAFYATPEDRRVHARIESLLGRRGRPSGEKVDWVVTCLEEMKSYEVLDQYHVANCPHCRGVKIRTRIGEMQSVILPDDMNDLFTNWRRHRFLHQRFERPITEGATQKLPVKMPSIVDDDEREAVKIMRNSPEFLRMLKVLPIETATDVLDAVLCARAHMSYERRLDSRVRTCIALFKRGLGPADVNMSEAKDEVDLLDGSAKLGAFDTKDIFLLARNKLAQKEGGK